MQTCRGCERTLRRVRTTTYLPRGFRQRAHPNGCDGDSCRRTHAESLNDPALGCVRIAALLALSESFARGGRERVFRRRLRAYTRRRRKECSPPFRRTEARSRAPSYHSECADLCARD